MKIIRKGNKVTTVKKSLLKNDDSEKARHVWKVLIVDDEPDVHEITKLNLKDFQFDERELFFIEANSAEQAKPLLREHSDFAVALIDVVMESDDAGLQLVHYIREVLNYKMIRLIIRTGQPGLAPERYVIDHFDIDDYKDKTELTTQKLYTTVRSALKSYRDLLVIDMNRRGLISILDATPEIYKNSRKSLPQFFQGILTQIVSLHDMDANAMLSILDGMVATIDNEEISVQAGTGEFEHVEQDNTRFQELMQQCSDVVLNNTASVKLRESALVLALHVEQKPVGFIYLELTKHLTEDDYNLIQLFANQCSAALESMQLNFNLKKSYNHAIDMLAIVSEFRDAATGKHINRLAMYTTILAIEMGLSDEEAERYGQSARLHDVGKVGIPDSILLKKGPLSDDEFTIIKTHTDIGVSILSGDEHFELAAEVSYCHHERWDGSGYPQGMKKENIPFIARIVSVIDVFDALISKRPYKEAWSCERAITEIKQGSGSQFDPQVVQKFVQLYDNGRFDSMINSMY